MDISISYSGAALAGILSFFSPCVLPLVPFYLCYLAGISMEEFKNERSLNNKLRKKLIFNTVFCWCYSSIHVDGLSCLFNWPII